MSARDRKLVWIIAPVAVLAAIWLLVLSPKVDGMKSARKDVATAQASLAQANQQLVTLQSNRDEVRAQQRKLRAAGRAVPASLAIPALLRQLERSAGHAGVSLDTVTQSAANGSSPAAVAGAAAGVSATGVSLNFEGRYRNVRRFLTRIDRLVRVSGQTIKGSGRLISVSSVGVAPTRPGRLTVAVEATIYKLDEAAQVAAAAAAAAGTTTPPDSGSASAPVTSAAVGAGG